MWLSILALIVACEGHVRLIHKSYFSRPIRNAGTPAADGVLSVSGPCGGSLKWGNNTYSTVTPGQNVSLVFAYNGGHQNGTLNMLRVAMICGRPDSDVLLKNTTVAPTFSPLVNASNSSTAGYDLWVIIPQIQAGTNGQFCTISALDVRNWGGCIDVEIVDPTAPTPAPAANALTGVSLGGSYPFGTSECVMDSPNCCCVNGGINVTHTTGATTATASFNFVDCVNGTSVATTNTVMLTQTASNLASVKGSVTLSNGKLLSFEATTTGVLMTDDSAVPMFCGIKTAGNGISPTPANKDTNSASVQGFFAAFVVAVAAALSF